MEDLDILKKNWKRQSQLIIFSEKELFDMTRKKSVSISKKLMWIGILEVLFWILFFYIDSDSLDSFIDLKFFLRIGLFMFFIFIIVYSYFKINNESSTTNLMKQILNLRRMVLAYMILMIFTILLFNVIDFKDSACDVLRGYVNGYNDAENENKINVSDFNPWAGYVAFGIMFLISIWLLLSVYKIVYGSLLYKLKENYKELTKIQTNN